MLSLNLEVIFHFFSFRDVFLSEKVNQEIIIVKPLKQNEIQLLKDFKLIHDKLMDCVDLTNYCFGLQTMLGIGLTFLFSIFTIFTAYKTFVLSEREFLNQSISSIYWSSYFNSLKTFIICICCINVKQVRISGKRTKKGLIKHFNL